LDQQRADQEVANTTLTIFKISEGYLNKKNKYWIDTLTRFDKELEFLIFQNVW